MRYDTRHPTLGSESLCRPDISEIRTAQRSLEDAKLHCPRVVICRRTKSNVGAVSTLYRAHPLGKGYERSLPVPFTERSLKGDVVCVPCPLVITLTGAVIGRENHDCIFTGIHLSPRGVPLTSLVSRYIMLRACRSSSPKSPCPPSLSHRGPLPSASQLSN